MSMNTFILAYDLYDAEAYDYQVLIEQLEKMDSDHLQQSVWLVNWDGNTDKLLAHLAPFLSKDDSVFLGLLDKNDFSNYLGEKGKNITIIDSDPFDDNYDWGSKLPKK